MSEIDVFDNESIIPATSINRGLVDIVQLLIYMPLALYILLPLLLISMQVGGVVQCCLMIGMIISFMLLQIPFKKFLDIRFYCCELMEYEIDSELEGKSIPGYWYMSVEDECPELRDVRLSKTMLSKEKRKAANEAAKKQCINWMFWVCVIAFVVCSVCWAIYPVFTGTGIITPVITNLKSYMISYYTI